ncbi:MAG: hypothetical protein K0U72_11940 [Gammaproteobacteria bacterium]|nr:hypothetical protein [Gammaproteobacteria bacterium]
MDQFFSDGVLRLSSFKSFRGHKDEQRGDQREGHANVHIETPNGTHTIAGLNGQEAYVLCTSTVESKTLEASFETASGFRITDSLRFAEAISMKIPGFVGGMQGLCSYRDNLVVRKTLDYSVKPPDSNDDPEEWAKDCDRFAGIQIRDSLFLKHQSYSHQCEYRFIWFAIGEETSHIDLNCPAARKFCQKLSD